MSSRQEEKERRRQARLEAEKAAAAAAARKRRLGMAAGGLLGVAAVAAIIVAFTAGGDDKSKETPKPTPAALRAKAQAAGCQIASFPVEGNKHTTAKVAYKTNPPTSGDHDPVPASDGIYDPGGTPPVGKLVHALEHGRIEYQYKKGTPPAVVQQLLTLMKDSVNGQPGGYLQLLYENTTGMQPQVAATAWTHSISCPTFKGAATLAALRDFRAAYLLQAPEKITVPE